jgi:hypothetical protein
MINLTARGRVVVDSRSPERIFRDKERGFRLEHSICTVDPYLHYMSNRHSINAYSAYIDAKTAADELYLLKMDKAWEEYKVAKGRGQRTSPSEVIRRANMIAPVKKDKNASESEKGNASV